MALRILVNGGFQDSSSAPLALGTVTFQMIKDIAASGAQVGAGIITTASLDVNGNIAGLVSLWSPATYFVKAFSAVGQLVWQSTLVIPDSPDPYSLTPGASASGLLQEDGVSFFLLEDGSGIILLEA